MKKIKKLISILLALVLVASPLFGSSNIKAASSVPYSTNVTIDNHEIRVAESYDGDYKYVSTYNKETKTVELQQFSIPTGEVIVTVNIDTQNAVALKVEDSDISTAFVTSTSIYENTYSNYEYTKTYGSPNEFELRRPDPNNPVFDRIYFKTLETTGNSTYISNFVDAVNHINSLEGKIAAAIGLEVLLSALGAVLLYFTAGAGAPLSAYLGSLGFAGTALYLAADFDYYCKRAEDNYWNVYYNSDIYF